MNTIIMLFLISLLILVHEIGHFAAARMFGVRVSKFGFGLPIGPTLFKTKWGNTEILVHAFLLGGYVSFPDDEEVKEKEGEPEKEENKEVKDEDILPPDSPERFKNKKPWQKAVIVSAGVFMNVIFAIFLTMLAAAWYHKLPTGTSDVFIKEIISKDNTSNILNSDVKPGDKIKSINGIKATNAYKFIFVVQKSKYFDGIVDNETITSKLNELKRLNPNVDFENVIKKDTKIILPKLTPEKPLNISENVASGYEKYETSEINLTKEEIKLRDELENKTNYTLVEDIEPETLAKALSDSFKPLTIVLERDGKEIVLNDIYTDKTGVLGIKLETKEIFTETNTPKEIVVNSLKYLWTNTKLMAFGLWQLVTGKIPMSEMHGIVVITKVGSDIIETYGMLNGLLLTAIISIDLAIINLLPIPALDGGHLMFLALEKILGREIDEKITETIGRIFFLLLIVLMVFVIFNDIFALVTHKF